MSTTTWIPKPGDPCPPLRYTQTGGPPHAFVDEDELARRREAWHAMNNAPPPDPPNGNAFTAATVKASGGAHERTTSEADGAAPAAANPHASPPSGPGPAEYAIDWAFDQDTGGPGPKLVLVALARHCFKPGDTRAFPSLDEIGARACMSRSAVRENLERLQELGLIHDSGERRGRTRQVIVWRLGKSAESDFLNGTESTPLNRSESVPFKGKGYGFGAERVWNPATEYPRKGEGGGAAGAAAGAAAAAPLDALPSGLRPDLFAQLLANGRQTEGRVARLVDQAQALAAGGHDLNAMAEYALDRGWAAWPKPPQKRPPRVAQARPMPSATDDWTVV